MIDAMLPGCWRELYPDRRPGCRDLISAALGIERRDLRGLADLDRGDGLGDERTERVAVPRLPLRAAAVQTVSIVSGVRTTHTCGMRQVVAHGQAASPSNSSLLLSRTAVILRRLSMLGE